MSAVFLLDSDICIYWMTRRSPDVMARFDQLDAGEARIPVAAYGELLFGVRKSRTTLVASSNLAVLTSKAPVDPLPVEAADRYAHIRHVLESAGTPIGTNDLWIAAHALASGLVLVTNNEREFRRVPGLEIENWSRPGVAERVPRSRHRRVATGAMIPEAVYVDVVADVARVMGRDVASFREEVDQLLAR